MSHMRIAAPLVLALCMAGFQPAPPALAQTPAERDLVARVFSDPNLVDGVVAAWGTPEPYKDVAREHAETIFGHPQMLDHFAREFVPTIAAMPGMPIEDQRRLALEIGAGISHDLVAGGMTRIDTDALYLLYAVLYYGLMHSSDRECAMITRDEMPADEAIRWEFHHVFSLRKEYARLYLQAVRSAMFAELTGRPSPRVLSTPQRRAAETIVAQRIGDMIAQGEMTGAIADPASASDAALCQDMRAFFRMVLDEEGAVGGWMLRLMAADGAD